jgi:arsenite-transporting ATPase
LGQRLGARPRAVTGVPRLQALELDASRALARWLARRRSTLAEIALRGTWLDHEDVTRLLALSLPGIDEIMALLELARLRRAARHDVLVVDTAPTGHTLRMLAMPHALRTIARVFDHMQDKHRTVVTALRGGWGGDAGDALVQELAAEADHMSSSLRDPSQSEMWWVTLPEAMAIEETDDALAALRGTGPAVTRVIVNRLTPPPPRPCRWCAARRSFERRSMARLLRRREWVISAIIARDSEPVGIHALRAIGDELETGRLRARGRAPAGDRLSRVRAVLPPLSSAPASLAVDSLRLILFGGKGGVGKTTCAAALAVSVAEADRSRRVQLLSTDPAHSLADVFGAGKAPPNLEVRELDAPAALADLRRRYSDAIDGFFDRIVAASGLDASHDRQIMRDLIDLAPPGIDELVAVIAVTDRLIADEAAFDLLIIDTAPSGHALRLLEMPALVRDWTRAMMAILLKYQPVIAAGALGSTLLRLSQAIGRLRVLLSDGERARFITVTRAAALPRAETGRLLRRLEALDIPSPLVIVNAAGAGDCRRCRRVRRVQAREIAAVQRTVGRVRRDVIVAAGETPPPAGTKALRAWQAGWLRVAP